MAKSETARPSLLIDEDLVEQKAYIASAVDTTEIDVIDMVISVLDGTSVAQHQKWEKRLSDDRRKKRKAHVMSDSAHRYLIDQKEKTGRSIGLQVEIGLLALSQATEDLLGLGRTRSQHILDRFFSHARETVEQLRDVDDKFAAWEIGFIDQHLDNRLREVRGELIDRAKKFDEPTLDEQIATLSSVEKRRLFEQLKQKMEQSENGGDTS